MADWVLQVPGPVPPPNPFGYRPGELPVLFPGSRGSIPVPDGDQPVPAGKGVARFHIHPTVLQSHGFLLCQLCPERYYFCRPVADMVYGAAPVYPKAPTLLAFVDTGVVYWNCLYIPVSSLVLSAYHGSGVDFVQDAGLEEGSRLVDSSGVHDPLY